MSRISFSLRIPNLTTCKLLEQGPDALASAAKSLSNPFWKVILAQMPLLERTFYTKNKKIIGERVIWDNTDFLHEGQTLCGKRCGPTLTHLFNNLNSFISTKTNVLLGEDEARDLLSEEMEKQLLPGASLDIRKLEGFLSYWKKAVSSASIYLNNLFIPWVSLTESSNGPTHWGWSRLITENFKSKKYYNLLMTRPPDNRRNPNELCRAGETLGSIPLDLKDLTNSIGISAS